MEPRINSSVLVGALRRKAEAQGGFATLLSKGDASAGAILILLLQPDGGERLVERILQPDGRYAWQETASESGEAAKLIERRRRFDPDLWIVELSLPDSEPFIAEINELF